MRDPGLLLSALYVWIGVDSEGREALLYRHDGTSTVELGHAPLMSSDLQGAFALARHARRSARMRGMREAILRSYVGLVSADPVMHLRNLHAREPGWELDDG